VQERPAYNVESMLSSFEKIIEVEIQQGNLPRDDRIHHQYRNAIRAMLEAGIAADGKTERLATDPQAALSHSFNPINTSVEHLSAANVPPGMRWSPSSATDPFLPELGPLP
jgi:hypothetical protein